MKNKFIIYALVMTLLTGSLSAQPAKPSAAASSNENNKPKESRVETKREELSKKLMERKVELRRADHEQQRAKERKAEKDNARK